MPRPDGTRFFPDLRDEDGEERRARIKAMSPQERAVLAKNLTPSMTVKSLATWRESMARMSPGVKDRVDRAVRFFERQFPAMSELDILSDIACIDFHRPVDDRVQLPVNTRLVGYKLPGSPALGGRYFTRVGYGPQSLGISLTGDYQGGPQTEKEFRLFRVIKAVPAVLESFAAPAADRWSLSARRVLAFGGGKQLCFPDATGHLELERTGTPELSARKAAQAFLKRG